MTERRIAGLVIATLVGGTSAAVTTSVAQQAAEGQTGSDGIVIDLTDGSRFDLAVAGTVQFNNSASVSTALDPAGPTIDGSVSVTSTTAAVGLTVDLDDTPLTTAVLSQPAPQPAGRGSDGAGAEAEAFAVTFIDADSDVGRRGMDALESIDYPWRQVLDGWTVSFQAGRSDVSAFVHFDRREIELFVRSSHSDAQLARVMAHEIGHVVDWRHVDDTERQRWLEQRGLTGRAWYPTSGTNDFFSPAGDFAEAFAVWLLGGQSAARIGGPVTQADLDLMALIGLPN